MPLKRTQTIGCRVTELEYLHFEKLAGRESVGNWMRKILLNAGEPTTKDEVLALRMIVVNLLEKLAAGEKITHATMAALIQAADDEKAKRVAERMK